MFPLFDPVVTLYTPVAVGLVAVAVGAVAGMVVVLGLVVRADRARVPSKASVTPIRPPFSEAA